MATKKALATKKAVKKPLSRSAATTTKVTTVKAVESRPEQAKSISHAPVVAGRRNGRFSLHRSSLVGAGIAEFVGTFLLAASILAGQGQPIWVLFTLAGIVLIVGGISGAHVNPAITVGAWVNRKIGAPRAIVYLVAQVLGALLAFLVLRQYVENAPAVSQQAALYGQSAAELFKANALPDGKQWAVLFAELLGATIFSFAVASAVREKRERIAAAFTVGFGIFIALLIAGSAASIVGGSSILNPAVAIALQAYQTGENMMWSIAIYALIPLVGGVLGFFLQDILRSDNDTIDDGDQLVKA